MTDGLNPGDVYNLIKDNEHFINRYIQGWLHKNFKIELKEVKDVCFLALMKYPSYTKYCLRTNSLVRVKYLRGVITRYLGFHEGNIKAKSLHKERLREVKVTTYGDDLTWIVDSVSKDNKINTLNIDNYIYKKNIYKYLSKKNLTIQAKKSLYLALTTDLTMDKIDRLLNNKSGYTCNTLRRFKRRINDYDRRTTRNDLP